MRRVALSLGFIVLAGCNVSVTNTLAAGSTHEGGVVATDEIWAAGAHTVNGSISVQGAKLTIEPGSTITMSPDSEIVVGTGGTLLVLGTSALRVVFTADSSSRGVWNGIYVESGASTASTIQNANILYAGESRAALTVDDGATLTLSYTRIEQSKDYGMQLKGRTLLGGFIGNAFINNALGPVATDAGSAEQLKAGSYTPNDLEGVVVEASTLDHDATWVDLGVAYVSDAVTVQTATATGSAILTLDANVIVQILKQKSWTVGTNGALVTQGTATQPVIFSSAQAVPAPGDWYEIDFNSDSLGASNHLSYTIVEYGGGDSSNYGEIWLADDAQVAIDHSIIQYSANYGVQALKTDADAKNGGKLPNFAYNTVTHNGSVGVALTADAVDGLQSSSVYGPNTANGVLVAAGLVTHSSTWNNLGTGYLVQGVDLTIGTVDGPVAPTLTLAAGSAFYFDDTVVPSVQQYGHLLVQGTATQPVTFTAAIALNGWREIDFRDSGSSLTYANFSLGGKGGYGQMWVANGATVALSNVAFTQLNGASNCSINLNTSGSVGGANSADSCAN